MKCEICKQRPATLHFANYINGQKKEVHLCQFCAMDNGYFETEKEVYTIHDLLSGLFNVPSKSTAKTETNNQARQKLVCPQCQMTYQQFSKLGKFGCLHCYETFSDDLNPIFKRVHGGNTKHVGKIPKRQHVHLQHKRLVQNYRDQLQELIKEERFEEAATLRDKIKALEQEGKATLKKGDDV